ncbi:MAG: hypothetical protein AB7D05_02930 [Mangrovibacterium sp.]
MTKTLTGLFFLLVLVLPAAAQQGTEDLHLSFYGFIRNEIFVDTYKGLDAAYELFYLVPLYAGQDAEGKDINRQISANLSALATRMGMRVEGPEVFGASTRANIEFDFGGIVKTEPTLFRIRQAWVAFRWEKTRLLAGQSWHPFLGGDLFPSVAGLNTGAPFQAFNRSPQLRFDRYAGNFIFTAAAVYENQYASKTMESAGFSSANQAQRNGVMPELVLVAGYRKNGLNLGAGAQLKRLKPRMTTSGTSGTYVADEYLTSGGVMAYLGCKKGRLNLTAKGYYGQNMTHLTLLGGYGVASRNETTGRETYTNYTNYSAYMNLVYGSRWQGGMTLGYGKNLGTGDPLYDDGSGQATVGGLLPNVMDVARLAPHLALNVANIRLVAEYELTTARYGTGEIDFSDGLYAVRHRTTNNRFMLMMMYVF